MRKATFIRKILILVFILKPNASYPENPIPHHPGFGYKSLILAASIPSALVLLIGAILYKNQLKQRASLNQLIKTKNQNKTALLERLNKLEQQQHNHITIDNKNYVDLLKELKKERKEGLKQKELIHKQSIENRVLQQSTNDLKEKLTKKEATSNNLQNGLRQELMASLSENKQLKEKVESLIKIENQTKKASIIFKITTEDEIDHYAENSTFDDVMKKINSAHKPNTNKINQLKSKYKPISPTFLLYGQPGCGKTLLVKYLSFKLSYPLGILNAADFIHHFVGQTERILKNIVDEVEKEAQRGKIIFFLDECDSFLHNRRGHLMQQYETNKVNEFLKHIEKLNQNPNVVVIAATNNFDGLDEAAIREGRFNYKIQVQPPTESDTRNFIDKYLPNTIFANNNDDDSKNVIINALVKSKQPFSYIKNIIDRAISEFVDDDNQKTMDGEYIKDYIVNRLETTKARESLKKSIVISNY